MKFTPAISIAKFSSIAFFGGHSEEVPPVPIPNTEVKLFSADGTAWETMWESRSPPVLHKSPINLMIDGAFFVWGYVPP